MEDDDDWIDVTAVGSSEQEQISRSTGRMRHRKMHQPPGALRPIDETFGEWKPGPAPKM